MGDWGGRWRSGCAYAKWMAIGRSRRCVANNQRVIAREHGHGSWAEFRRDVEPQANAPGRSVARIGPSSPERYDNSARRLLRMLADGESSARRACARMSPASPI